MRSEVVAVVWAAIAVAVFVTGAAVVGAHVLLGWFLIGLALVMAAGFYSWAAKS